MIWCCSLSSLHSVPNTIYFSNYIFVIVLFPSVCCCLKISIPLPIHFSLLYCLNMSNFQPFGYNYQRTRSRSRSRDTPQRLYGRDRQSSNFPTASRDKSFRPSLGRVDRATMGLDPIQALQQFRSALLASLHNILVIDASSHIFTRISYQQRRSCP